MPPSEPITVSVVCAGWEPKRGEEGEWTIVLRASGLHWSGQRVAEVVSAALASEFSHGADRAPESAPDIADDAEQPQASLFTPETR